MRKADPLRHHRNAEHLAGVFGGDTFGRQAERFARFFGTPKFIIGQTLIVIVWIAMNALVVALRWDPYPFILLNLAFSTQAAYAAPLILLAQTRQADRDKAQTEADAKHREELADLQRQQITENTDLTKTIHSNTICLAEIHQHVGAIATHFGLATETETPKPTPKPVRKRVRRAT